MQSQNSSLGSKQPVAIYNEQGLVRDRIGVDALMTRTYAEVETSLHGCVIAIKLLTQKLEDIADSLISGKFQEGEERDILRKELETNARQIDEALQAHRIHSNVASQLIQMGTTKVAAKLQYYREVIEPLA